MLKTKTLPLNFTVSLIYPFSTAATYLRQVYMCLWHFSSLASSVIFLLWSVTFPTSSQQVCSVTFLLWSVTFPASELFSIVMVPKLTLCNGTVGKKIAMMFGLLEKDQPPLSPGKNRKTNDVSGLAHLQRFNGVEDPRINSLLRLLSSLQLSEMLRA